MIEMLSDMPEGVTGIRVSGRLSGEELRGIKPTVAGMFDSGGEIRILEVIDEDYEGFGPGGLVEDLKLGLGTVLPHYATLKRTAIVSDKDWVAHAVHALAWMVPGEVAVFGLDEIDRAKQWAAG